MEFNTPQGQRIEQPAYQKLSIITLGLCALVYGLYVAAGIIVPLLFAMLLAMLLNPMVNRLNRWRFHRILAITLAVLVAMLARHLEDEEDLIVPLILERGEGAFGIG